MKLVPHAIADAVKDSVYKAAEIEGRLIKMSPLSSLQREVRRTASGANWTLS
jgi:hypothetical protein